MPASFLAFANTVELSAAELVQHLRGRSLLHGLAAQALAEKVAVGAALDAGLAVDVAELQRAADRFRQRHGLASAERTGHWLAQEGMTVDDFEAGLERDLLVARFKEHLTQPRVAEHFEANRSRYAHAQLRHLVAGSEEVARELFAQIQDEGRDFAELAREHSRDGASRHAGGSLGLVPRLALPASAADAVFAAKVGTVVGPVATSQGFHLFLVEALPEPQLDDATAAVIREELFAAWLQEQLQDVRIDLGGLRSS